ncbi:transglutaminase-like domain-containing protein [Streptomyces sp. NPDC049879]|uniref:transglutaminase-like domain-containing protein n=1 Tax=Streptomyces sp. NPDC049879 TaxID=3365598 RepID=UPI0037878A5D
MPETRLEPAEAAYYTTQSPFSDPGDQVHLYDALPADPARLARVARDLVIHRMEGPLYGYDIPADRLAHDAETRYTEDTLRLIVSRDPAPLTEPRAPADRFVGICRDIALLHCSMLRHTGTPARVRSGFARYFSTDGFHDDHMVTEYWAPGRGWLLADAELADPLVTDRFGIAFDPLDIPRDRFLVAGRAWQALRTGEADPARFGLRLPDGALTGSWFVAGNVRLDIAALNRTETLLWDIWGEGADSEAEMTDTLRALYDRAAPLSSDTVPFDAVRTLFRAEDGLRTPATVLSLAPFDGPSRVTLRTAQR